MHVGTQPNSLLVVSPRKKPFKKKIGWPLDCVPCKAKKSFIYFRNQMATQLCPSNSQDIYIYIYIYIFTIKWPPNCVPPKGNIFSLSFLCYNYFLMYLFPHSSLLCCFNVLLFKKIQMTKVLSIANYYTSILRTMKIVM
jgi:hypothetical protein